LDLAPGLKPFEQMQAINFDLRRQNMQSKTSRLFRGQRPTIWPLLLLVALIATAQNVPEPRYTARELFYSAASAGTPAARNTPQAGASAPKKATSPKKPSGPSPAIAATENSSRPTPPVASSPDSAMVVKTALTTAPAPKVGTPLGLEYTILKKSGDGMVRVPPDAVFRTGDRIRLSIRTNGPGYLYVVTQGASSTWSLLFPTPDLAGGDNHVNGWTDNVVPPNYMVRLDEPAGPERVFIVLSRTPEESLENMIYALQGAASPKKLVQAADIPDATMAHIHDTYATRDLILEKIDESKSPEKENAVYVVNTSGNSDSRVVAEFTMMHQ
jgi:hypothetical protein